MEISHTFLSVLRCGVEMVALLLWVSACGSIEGPYSAEEALTRVRASNRDIPILTIDPDHAQSNFSLKYFYSDVQDDGWVIMYVIESENKKSVAKLRSAWIHVMGISSEQHEVEVIVQSADASRAYACEPSALEFGSDAVLPSKPYQDCLKWRIRGREIVLYSSLSPDETIALANSLKEIR